MVLFSLTLGFVYFCFGLHWFFIAALGLSPVEKQVGLLLSCGAQASHCDGFSCCRALALWQKGSVVVSVDLIALWPVGSSWTRDLTHVPCVGRWILNHQGSPDIRIPKNKTEFSEHFLCSLCVT